MEIALLGTTGYVGGRLVPMLLDAGHGVRCLVRDPARLRGVDWEHRVDIVQADALEPETLRPGFDGAEAVYHLIHSMGGADDFDEADRRAAANVAEAAAAAEVRRIVYLGGLGDDSAGLSDHLHSRHEVGRVLADGPVPVTELRAAVVIGSGSASFEMLRSLVERLPAMVCPRWVTSTQCQPIAIRDVLRYLVDVLDVAATAGRVLDVGGPDVLSYREMMDRYADAAGLRRRVIVPVPVLTPRLSSHWVNLVTPLPIGLARPLVGSLVNDVVVRPDHDVRELIAHEPLGFDDAIRVAIERVQGLDVSTSWTDSSRRSSPAQPLPTDPDWSGGTLYEDLQDVATQASAHELFTIVSGVGGARGWYVTPTMWKVRGLLDKLVGGVGMRRGRRHPDHLRTGDALDFFRVEAYEPDHLLRLRAEMRVPGRAWLEWEIDDEPTGRRLRQRALFHPRGIAGRLYWYCLLPIHTLIFRLLARRLVDAAAAAAERNAAA